MDDTIATGDIIIGLFAAIGVVVLVAVFFFVVKSVFFRKEKE